jgi:hypothetical protein
VTLSADEGKLDLKLSIFDLHGHDFNVNDSHLKALKGHQPVRPPCIRLLHP